MNELCDHIDRQAELVDAARALILAYKGLGVLCLYTDDLRRLEAALGALQTEEGER